MRGIITFFGLGIFVSFVSFVSCDEAEDSTASGGNAGASSIGKAGNFSATAGSGGTSILMGNAGTMSSLEGGSGGLTGSAGSGGGAALDPTCGGAIKKPGDPCQACIKAKCCEEATACQATENCKICNGAGIVTALCREDPENVAVQSCSYNKCGDECSLKADEPDTFAPAQSPSGGLCYNDYPGLKNCNPVLNSKCSPPDGSSPGQGVCDEFSSENVYVCYGPPQSQNLGEPCGVANDFCLEGMQCFNPTNAPAGKCARYCCGDGDCGPNGYCNKTAPNNAAHGRGVIGSCLIKNTNSNGGAGGAGGLSGSGGASGMGGAGNGGSGT